MAAATNGDSEPAGPASAAERLRSGSLEARSPEDPARVRQAIRSASRRMSARMGSFNPREVAALQFLQRQQRAHDWLTRVLGEGAEPLPARLHDALKSGVVLCEVANALAGPAADPVRPNQRYSTVHAAFKERENISHFLRRCRAMGVDESSLFDTNDLYDNQNMVQVFQCLHALALAAEGRGRANSGSRRWSLDNSGPATAFSRDEIQAAADELTEEATGALLRMSTDARAEEVTASMAPPCLPSGGQAEEGEEDEEEDEPPELEERSAAGSDDEASTLAPLCRLCGTPVPVAEMEAHAEACVSEEDEALVGCVVG